MTQEIWFLRHGAAEPHGAKLDSERELTDKGREQAKLAGAALRKLGADFDAVFMSPKIRARDTALLACEALSVDPVVHEPLARGFDAQEALSLASGFGADARIMVVGHEPTFSQSVYDLTGGRIDMKKGGVAAVQVSGTGSYLLALLRPHELKVIAT